MKTEKETVEMPTPDQHNKVGGLPSRRQWCGETRRQFCYSETTRRSCYLINVVCSTVPDVFCWYALSKPFEGSMKTHPVGKAAASALQELSTMSQLQT